jgi:hypothetical protein
MTPPAMDPRPQGTRGEESGQPAKPEPSPAGTRRRLQVLAARSWSPRAIEKETGIAARLIRRVLVAHEHVRLAASGPDGGLI